MIVAGLTNRQRDLLKYIWDFESEKGIAPSFDEMKDAMCLASKSGVSRLVNALEERGFIARLPNRARAITVLHPPSEKRSPLVESWKSASVQERQDFLYLINAKIERAV